MAFGL
ncbi:Protein of unknown function [Bacillus cereus]